MKLTLQQKLALSRRPNYLTLFSEKAFLRVYNESVYLLSKQLNKKLTPVVFKMQHKPFQSVVMASLPKRSLLIQLPQLQKTEFGYESKVKSDLSGYCDWLVINECYCGSMPQ